MKDLYRKDYSNKQITDNIRNQKLLNLELKENKIELLFLHDLAISQAKIYDTIIRDSSLKKVYINHSQIEGLYFFKCICDTLTLGQNIGKLDLSYIDSTVLNAIVPLGELYFNASTLINLDFNNRKCGNTAPDTKNTFILSYCKVYNCSFREADLRGSYMLSNEFFGCDFTGAIYNEYTHFPLGFNKDNMVFEPVKED